MQPPFDLNLMKTNLNRDTSDMIAKADAASSLKRNKTKSIARARGQRIFQSVWHSLIERATAQPVSQPY